MTLPKTFNNLFGFERGLWQRQSGWCWHVPKTSVFGKEKELLVSSLFIVFEAHRGGETFRPDSFQPKAYTTSATTATIAKKITPKPDAFILPMVIVDAIHVSQNFFILISLIVMCMYSTTGTDGDVLTGLVNRRGKHLNLRLRIENVASA